MKTSGDDDVDDRADDEGADDPDRHVALRVAALLGDRRDGVEADVGEEDDRRARRDSREPVGREGMPVRGLDVLEADEDEEAEDDELDRHHPEVEVRGLPDPPDEHDRDGGDDRDGEDVEDDRDAEDVRRRGHDGRHLRERRLVVDREPRGQVDPEALQERVEVVRPRDRDGDVADRVLDDQVPADDPGDELAERAVGVRVGGAGDGHHRGELRVAEGREAADDRRQDEGEDQRRSRARPDGVARGRRADRREDAGPDDRADAERDDVPGAERALQRVSRLVRLRDERVERLASGGACRERLKFARRIAGGSPADFSGGSRPRARFPAGGSPGRPEDLRPGRTAGGSSAEAAAAEGPRPGGLEIRVPAAHRSARGRVSRCHSRGQRGGSGRRAVRSGVARRRNFLRSLPGPVRKTRPAVRIFAAISVNERDSVGSRRGRRGGPPGRAAARRPAAARAPS